MPDHSNQDNRTENSENLFGEPALLKGENKDHYGQLLAAVKNDLNPKNSIEGMMVHDHANKYWEEGRFRRISAALIEGAKVEALETLLRPYSPDAHDIVGAARFEGIARNYFSGDTSTKKKAIADVTRFGITPDHIEAKAMQLVIGPLHVIDRMCNSRETSRRILRKEHEQLRNERERVHTDNGRSANHATGGPEEI